MSLLKNLISDAVSDGVGRGIRDAVGKAVETAVQPAADKLAGQAAEQINQATQSLEKSTQAASAAQSETGSTAQSETGSAAQAASQAKYSGTASLEAALKGWTGAMQTAAGQAVQNMKECPRCGEIVTADHKFCPKCGTALPEKTIGEAYLCPKCGKQNLPETVYCVECGTRLPAAEAAYAQQISKWEEWIPHYPKWDLGGEFDVMGQQAFRQPGIPCPDAGFIEHQAVGIVLGSEHDHVVLLGYLRHLIRVHQGNELVIRHFAHLGLQQRREHEYIQQQNDDQSNAVVIQHGFLLVWLFFHSSILLQRYYVPKVKESQATAAKLP